MVFVNTPVGVLLALSAISVIFGDYFAKVFSTNQKPIFYILAIIGYLGSGFFYIPTLFKEGLVITSIIWSILSTAGFLVIGLLIFKEHLNLLQTAGVALGFASILLLTFGTK